MGMTDPQWHINQFLEDLARIENAEDSLTELQDVRKKWEVLKGRLEDDERLKEGGY